MIIENKTTMFQKCAGKVVRPWRRATVPDGSQVNLKVFTIIENKKPKIKKEIKGD